MKQNDLDALFNAAKNGDEKTMEKLGGFAAANLSQTHKETIERAMSDPEYLKNILSSEKAQQILKKLQGGDD